MASELLKNRALIQRLKEPEVPVVKFNLGDTGFEELITLPEPKPQELLDIQEENRKGRLLDSLNKIGGGLMDESVDFIKREEFADGPKVAAKKSLLKFINPTYLKAKTPTEKSSANVLKKMGDTEKFYKKFIEYRDKFFEGNTSAAQKSLFPGTDTSSGPQIIQRMRQRLGLKAEEDFAKKAKIKGLKEGLTFSEFRTKLVKEPDFLKKVTKGANVNKFYNTRDLFNLFGITTERGNPKANEYFTGELKRAGVEGRFNPAGGTGKQYKLKDVIKFFKETPKTTKLGLTPKETVDARIGAEQRLDKELYNFNKGVVKNVRETAIAEDVYIPTKTLRASPGDHIGHPVSVKITDKPEFKNLLKDSNVNKINSLVFQDAEININALTKQTGYDQKFNTYFKQLNKFLNKPITEKNRTELIKIKNDMDGHYNKIINRINNMSEKNEFFKGQEKRIPKVTINIPEVGSKFKSSDLFADMSTVDPDYRYGKIQEINPNAKLFKDLSLDEKQIFKQNIYNQYSDNLNAFYKAAKIPVQDVEEFSEFIEAGGVRETVGKKDLIPTATDSKNIAKKLASFGFKCSAAEGGACDNPMNYLDDIKKQQAIAQGSGNAAANAAKKLSAGKAIFREVLGPAALGFELAAAVPITYLGYKAGLPPARIVADATYGLFGETEKARLKKEAVKAGIDTAEIQQALDFEKAYRQAGVTAAQEQDFRGPDDEMLYPQQYEKAFEDLGKEIERFESPEQYKRYGSQLQQVRDYIAKLDADTAAERASKIADAGLGGIDDIIIDEPEEQPILPVFDFQEPSTRMDFSEGSPKDPSRRTFLKFMAGIASLPFVGKFFKAAKAPKVVKLANTTTTMPDWFPAFIDKAFEKGIAKKVDADITEVDIPELPNVKVRKYDDGRIEVEGKNGYGEPYEIDYTPPGYELVDETTGKAVKTPGEFQANDTVYRRVGPEGDDFDVDFEVVDDVEQILGGDSTALEGFAKGTGKSKYTTGQRNLDAADAIQERADVFEGPDIDMSDYED